MAMRNKGWRESAVKSERLKIACMVSWHQAFLIFNSSFLIQTPGPVAQSRPASDWSQPAWRRAILAVLLVLAWRLPVACAQAAPADSLTLTHADFLDLVSRHHPVARQAALNPERARQEIRQARGAFDPGLNAKYYGKQLRGSDYYHDWETALRIPTWFGIEAKAGWDRGTGPYLNPQEYTATSGLSYLGLSVPLAQGLLIDERRTALRVAQALAGLAEAERRAIRNKLLLSASKDYWDWALARERLRLLAANEQVAAVRFAATRQRVLAGDLAAIDSVEALMELQSRQGQRVAARVQAQNAALVVASYLWDAEGRPPRAAAQCPAAAPTATPGLAPAPARLAGRPCCPGPTATPRPGQNPRQASATGP